MNRFILAALATLVAPAAPLQAQTSPAAADQQSAEPVSVSDATKMFVISAAMTDLFEIAAGHLALKNADGPAYLDCAQLIIADHTNTSEALKKIVANLRGVQLPLTLDSAHRAKLDQLGSLSGAAFEREFKTEQVAGHRQAVAMFENFANSSDNAELKSWAAQTLPTLRMHLQHAEALPSPQAAPTTGSGTKSK
jgi:putative membrane protein